VLTENFVGGFATVPKCCQMTRLGQRQKGGLRFDARKSGGLPVYSQS
jgi:hypothetical protein